MPPSRLYVPPSGNPMAKIAICGEYPSTQEIIQGKLFTGSSGRVLDECLQLAGLTRHELYFTSVIKDINKSLHGYINIDNKGKYTISPEGYEKIQDLGEELSKLNLNIIIACGNVALLALTNRIGITKWRHSLIESTLVPGLKVLPTFNPDTLIPPKFNYINKPLIIQDLKKAKDNSLTKDLILPQVDIIVKPSYEQSIDYLRQCYKEGLEGAIVSMDIEVINEQVDCIGFSYNPSYGICIPFKDHLGDYFTITQELEIMKMVEKILSSEKISKVGANFIFDLQFIMRKYGIVPRGDIHCTQIAQKIAYPDLPAGLDNVTRIYTNHPYYKEDGKKWMKIGAGTWEEWWRYNTLDAIVPSESIPKQIKLLQSQYNEETYDRQRKLIPILIYMAEKGIKIDVEGMKKCKEGEQSKLESLSEELNKEVGYSINYNSPKQLKEYFYDKLGLDPYKNRKTGKESTDVDALKRLVRKGYKAAQILLDIRSLSKRISTYLNLEKVDPDGRYRSSYKPVGTDTGRISSGETIFGTGGNQQNWPHDLLRFFIADEGYIIYAFDLAQAENRIVAYSGNVLSQIKAFEEGIDLHRMTASFIFDKSYDQISGKDGSSTLGDGRQSERYWGKKGNHAINYDVSYKTFSLVNEMPERDAKNILEKIHRGYPEIRNGYQQMIIDSLIKTRTVVNLMGRTRVFLGPIVPSYPNTPEHACRETYRAAFAHLPQSTVSDKINEHGLERIFYHQEEFRPIELLTQIHDSIVMQIPLSFPLIHHAEMLLKIKQSLEIPLKWKSIEFPTPADLSIGFNMCKEKMIELKHKSFPSTKELLAEKLEETITKLKSPITE